MGALSGKQAFSFLTVLILFLGFAHSFGYLFERFKQPRVIGEILVGVILGYTGLFHIAPELFDSLYNIGDKAIGALGGLQELGLILLMFCSGFEISWKTRGPEIKKCLWMSAFGLLLPLGAAYFLVDFVDLSSMYGSIRDESSMRIIFMLAVAVTSIPVISRILADLNLLNTKFARIVLSVALLEDLVLYGILSALLAKHEISGGGDSLIKQFLGIDRGSSVDFFYNFVVVLGLFVISLAFGPRFFKRLKDMRINFLFKGNQSAFILVFLFSMVLLAKFIGVASIFASFLAGMIVGSNREAVDSQLTNIRNFSFSTFIPLYFVGVGFSLDLYSEMSWVHFLNFFILSSVIKLASIYLSGITYKQDHKLSLAYSFALNARGGPGIVLATICFNADLISKSFFGVLVMTALLTSLVSGFYLRRNRDVVLSEV